MFSFKKPSSEELDHNFLWRYMKAPARARPHRHLQPLLLRGRAGRAGPPRDCSSADAARHAIAADKFWEERYDDINRFERHLVRNGTLVLKFFLNVSKKEQKKRFLERLEKPEKHWKFSFADLEEREYWDDYQEAFERDAAAHQHASGRRGGSSPPITSGSRARSWRGSSPRSINDLGLEFPKVSAAQRRRLEAARRELSKAQK